MGLFIKTWLATHVITINNLYIITAAAEPLRIISGSEWHAEPPEANLTKLELPVSRVIIGTTNGENCTTQVKFQMNFERFQRENIFL